MTRTADSNPPPVSGDPATGLLATISRAHVLYPNAYVWFVFVSAMDVMLTWKVIERHGTEINPVARLVIDNWGLPGAIIFKFSLMIFVIAICEYIGRTVRSMRWLAVLAVVLSALPVAYSIALLMWHVWQPVMT